MWGFVAVLKSWLEGTAHETPCCCACCWHETYPPQGALYSAQYGCWVGGYWDDLNRARGIYHMGWNFAACTNERERAAAALDDASRKRAADYRSHYGPAPRRGLVGTGTG